MHVTELVEWCSGVVLFLATVMMAVEVALGGDDA
jgi:hypothetical protein